MVERTGSAKTHSAARRRLRLKLRAAGYSEDVVFLRVEALRAMQGRISDGRNVSKRRRIFVRDGFCCRYCGRPVQLEGHGRVRATIDHVLPKCRGGGNEYENLVTACSKCNRLKASRTPEEAGMPLLPLVSDGWCESRVWYGSGPMAHISQEDLTDA